ncbi:MAG: cytochrome c biogenesis protein CcsA [Actinomycetes bacterium]
MNTTAAAADARTRLLPRGAGRTVDALTLLAIGALVVFGLVIAPPDAVQGDAQRIMYLHVPAAWAMYLAFFVTTLASVLWLVPRTRSMVWDRVAGSSAEIGLILTGLTLVLGSLWGRPIWGVWWAWDARLVTTAVLFFLYLGLLALRAIPADPNVRARRSAITALIVFIDVPIVHFSVNWWRTLHQEATVFNPELNPQIEGSMALTLWIGVLAFTLLYVALLDRRYRLATLEEGLAERELDAAIEARVTAGTGSAP